MTTLTTTNVTGRISLPDDTSPANATLVFTISQFDLDAALDITVLNHRVVTPIDENGDINVDLWPNSRGLKGTAYSVACYIRGPISDQQYKLGGIFVPADGPVDINDLFQDYDSVGAVDYGSINDATERALNYGSIT